jgi:DNA repair exonuclease SbcCD nuclease subunit
MPLFLHTADWQIGRQFASFDPEVAPLLADARIAVVERIARRAADLQADAVLVAGDVFDAQTVSDRIIRRCFNAMAAYGGPWLLIPGNHDAALDESVWSRAQRLGAVPPHVHLLLTPEVRVFADQGFAVLPAPLTARHTHGDLSAWFDGADTPPGLLRIGLGHGSVQGLLAGGIDATNPIAPDRALRARLDYFALGDWHGTRRIDARTWYAGTPEPDRFRDNDAGQVLEVRIDGPGLEPRVTAWPSGAFRWQSWSLRLDGASDVDPLADRLAALGAADVLDLRLSGELDLATRERLERHVGEAAARCRHLVADLDGLRLLPTDEDLAGLAADGYVGELLAELREESRSVEPATAQRAQDALALLARALVRLRAGTAPVGDRTAAGSAAPGGAA